MDLLIVVVLKEKRMLYKKYHRNFVRQFKKGVSFKYPFSRTKVFSNKVIIEPHIIIGRVCVNSWTLVFSRGHLDKSFIIEEDVV